MTVKFPIQFCSSLGGKFSGFLTAAPVCAMPRLDYGKMIARELGHTTTSRRVISYSGICDQGKDRPLKRRWHRISFRICQRWNEPCSTNIAFWFPKRSQTVVGTRHDWFGHLGKDDAMMCSGQTTCLAPVHIVATTLGLQLEYYGLTYRLRFVLFLALFALVIVANRPKVRPQQPRCAPAPQSPRESLRIEALLCGECATGPMEEVLLEVSVRDAAAAGADFERREEVVVPSLVLSEAVYWWGVIRPDDLIPRSHQVVFVHSVLAIRVRFLPELSWSYLIVPTSVRASSVQRLARHLVLHSTEYSCLRSTVWVPVTTVPNFKQCTNQVSVVFGASEGLAEAPTLALPWREDIPFPENEYLSDQIVHGNHHTLSRFARSERPTRTQNRSKTEIGCADPPDKRLARSEAKRHSPPSSFTQWALMQSDEFQRSVVSGEGSRRLLHNLHDDSVTCCEITPFGAKDRGTEVGTEQQFQRVGPTQFLLQFLPWILPRFRWDKEASSILTYLTELNLSPNAPGVAVPIPNTSGVIPFSYSPGHATQTKTGPRKTRGERASGVAVAPLDPNSAMGSTVLKLWGVDRVD
ncbi:hypothetical protein EDB83DRAFT_2321257 [Lactarius deliciosus]|nr:hypothetical protein EDB83DRAFT_2321257 [Lactarius deliciosus]